MANVDRVKVEIPEGIRIYPIYEAPTKTVGSFAKFRQYFGKVL